MPTRGSGRRSASSPASRQQSTQKCRRVCWLGAPVLPSLGSASDHDRGLRRCAGLPHQPFRTPLRRWTSLDVPATGRSLRNAQASSYRLRSSTSKVVSPSIRTSRQPGPDGFGGVGLGSSTWSAYPSLPIHMHLQQMPRAPDGADDESGPKDAVTRRQPGDGESRPPEFLEEAACQACRDASDQRGCLVVRSNDGREKDRRDSRER